MDRIRTVLILFSCLFFQAIAVLCAHSMNVHPSHDAAGPDTLLTGGHSVKEKLNSKTAEFDSLFQPGYGILEVHVNPQNATVILKLRDSVVRAGTGNIRMDSVQEEVYKLFVEAEGYKPENRIVLISADQISKTSFRLEKNDTTKINYLSHNMILVKGGKFLMGSNNNPDEQPPHEVVLHDFYIGKYEVTQQEWIAVMEEDPSHWIGDDLPVEGVSWEAIQTFLKRLNERTGHRYRLPTEAEWEYAARGGAQTKGFRYSGSDSLDEVAWYEDNSDGRTHRVGELKPNELGLYDMSGNVWEWCQDYYDAAYYKHSPGIDPHGPEKGDNRILRGGSWYDDAHADSFTYRNWYQPWRSFRNDGFRLAESKE